MLLQQFLLNYYRHFLDLLVIVCVQSGLAPFWFLRARRTSQMSNLLGALRDFSTETPTPWYSCPPGQYSHITHSRTDNVRLSTVARRLG